MKNIKRTLGIMLVCVVALAMTPAVSFANFGAQQVSKDGNWYYLADYSNSTCKVIHWKGSSATLAIPAKIDGLKVVEVDFCYQCGTYTNSNIDNRDMITAISIPSTVKTLDDYCFNNLTNLQSAVIPNTVTKLGSGMFSACHSLKEFTFPSRFTAVPDSMFSGCTSLEKITLPSGVTAIGSSTFRSCSSLKSIKLPSKLKFIGAECFRESGLESISIPNSVKDMHYGSNFMDCASMKTVKLSTGMTVLPGSCFKGCTSLETVTIPSCYKEIKFNAFAECSALTTVVCQGNTILNTYEAAVTPSAKVTIYGPKTKTMVNVPNYCNEKGVRFVPMNPPTMTSRVRSDSSATLQWKKVSGATGYKVYEKVGNGSYRAVMTMGPNATSYSCSGLNKGTAYRFYVTTLKTDVLGDTIESGRGSIYITYLK